MTAHATTVDRLRGGAHRAPLTVALTCAMAWSWPIDAAETTPAAVPSPAAPVNQGAGNPPPTPPATPATVIGVSPQQAPASTSPASQSDQAPASASPEMPAGQAPASASAESPADQASMTASPPSAADQAGAAPVGTSRDDAIAEFRRRHDAKDYAGAIVQGRHVIAILRQDPATNPEDLQTAMMNLGAVQVLGEDYLGAEETYKSVIAALESQGRMTTPRMARAAAGLANSYYFAKRYELAANAYERAIQLNRRNEGLFNEEQLPLLDRHADSLTALGRLEEALQSLAYGMRIADRRWGSQDQRTIDRLEQLGRWYTRVHAWEAGRQALRSAVRLIEKRSGPYAMELVSPLRGIADSYLSQLLDPAAMRESAEESHTSVFGDSNNPSGMPGRTPGLLASEGERALERAIEIIDHQPHPPPLQVASVHTQMGDWYQTRLQTDRAMPHYRLAWGAAGDAPPIDGQSFREFLFGKPTLLHFDRLTEWDRYAKKPPNEVEPHTVEIDLTVNAEGRVRARKLVSNDGDAHLAEDALEAADTARYRPRFLDGNPVETSDVRLTQTYYQPIQAPKTPEGEPQAPATASPETASSQPAQTPPADSGETAAPAKPADTTPETTAPVTSPERSSTSHAT
jgi:tetratricopeptide (TPR) repeat protein